MATVVVVVPIAASRSTASKERAYDLVVRQARPVARATRAGVSSDAGLLSVDGRSVLAGADRAGTRSLELWARPRRSRRLALSWEQTTLRFRTPLPARRFTHVVVSWGGEAIELRYDGNVVERASLDAPGAVASRHRVALAAPASLREVALYRHGLDVRTLRRHEQAGAALFGRLPLLRSIAGGSTPIARAAAVPGNTALPAITGTAKDGQTLTSSNGTWSGSPTSYTRAWQRCDSAGANCTAISGATATTYLLSSSDVGRTIRVKVTATNGSGSGNATSAQTATITAAAPASTALPTVSGTAKDGQTLTATTGTWTGSTPITYTYQWRRCDTSGASCVDVSGQTTSTYILGSADVGRTIRLAVTATNSAGNAAAASAQTATVTTAAPANTALPAITGTVKEGQALTASTGTWSGSSPVTYAYQWQSCSSTCAANSGATLSTYRLALTDVGRTVKVVVTATNSAGNATATSTATASVTAGPPVNTVLPTVTGTAKDGQTLTTANGTWAGTAMITYARQWKRCTSAGASCTAISGATGTTYTLTSADIGSTIRVTWTATNSVGSTSSDSAATAVVVPALPASTNAPSVTGTAQREQTLSAADGDWTGTRPITYSRIWQRCDGDGTSCTAISGATSTTYVLAAADVGKRIRVDVAATNTAGEVHAVSAATAVVAGRTPVITTPPTISGTARDGEALSAQPGQWQGAESFTYQWQRCSGTAGNDCGNIDGATDSTYVLTSNDVGERIRIRVTGRSDDATVSAISDPTSLVSPSPPASTRTPSISGAPSPGRTVVADPGGWGGSTPMTYSFAWERCASDGTSCAAVPGATRPTYTVSDDDLDGALRISVSASNAAGSASAVTSATVQVTSATALGAGVGSVIMSAFIPQSDHPGRGPDPQLYVVDPSGSIVNLLTSAWPSGGPYWSQQGQLYNSGGDVALSPDHRQAAFEYMTYDDSGPWPFKIAVLDTSKRYTLTGAWSGPGPDYKMHPQVLSPDPIATLDTQSTNNGSQLIPDGIQYLPDGQLLIRVHHYSSTSQGSADDAHAYLVDPAAPAVLRAAPDDYLNAAGFFPDGDRYLLVNEQYDADGSPAGMQVVIKHRDGSVASSFHRDWAFYSPSISPDGTRITYLGGPDGGDDLRVVKPDGSDDHVILDQQVYIQGWLPDGNTALVCAYASACPEALDLATGQTIPWLLGNSGIVGAWIQAPYTKPGLTIDGENGATTYMSGTADSGDVMVTAHDAGTGISRIEALSDSGAVLATAGSACSSGCPHDLRAGLTLDRAAFSANVNHIVIRATSGSGTISTEPVIVAIDSEAPDPIANDDDVTESDYDADARAATLEFDEPDDPAVSPEVDGSGTEGANFRYSVAGGSWSTWHASAGAEMEVDDVDPGTQVDVQVQPIDAVGNGTTVIAQRSVVVGQDGGNDSDDGDSRNSVGSTSSSDGPTPPAFDISIDAALSHATRWMVPTDHGSPGTCPTGTYKYRNSRVFVRVKRIKPYGRFAHDPNAMGYYIHYQARRKARWRAEWTTATIDGVSPDGDRQLSVREGPTATKPSWYAHTRANLLRGSAVKMASEIYWKPEFTREYPLPDDSIVVEKIWWDNHHTWCTVP